MTRAICIGECMVELRPAGDGLYRAGFAGDVYNTAVYLKRSAPRWTCSSPRSPATIRSAAPCASAWAARGLATPCVAGRTGRPARTLHDRTRRGGERRFHYWRGESAARGGSTLARRSAARLLDGARPSLSLGHLAGDPAREDRRRRLNPGAYTEGRVGLDRLRSQPPPRSGASIRRGASHDRADGPGSPTSFCPADEERSLRRSATPDTQAARSRGWRRARKSRSRAGPGCLVIDGRSTWSTRCPRSQSTSDTSGAGDSFTGAYLAARLSGAAPVAPPRPR